MYYFVIFQCNSSVKFSIKQCFEHCKRNSGGCDIFFIFWNSFLYPATKKWRGIMLYPRNRFEYLYEHMNQVLGVVSKACYFWSIFNRVMALD